MRQPRSRATRSARQRLQDPLGPNAITMSSGVAEQLQLGVHRPALGGERKRGQRALADDHRVHELDRHVARVRARRRVVAEREQPPAAGEALGHAVAQPRDPLGLASKKRPCRQASLAQVIDLR